MVMLSDPFLMLKSSLLVSLTPPKAPLPNPCRGERGGRWEVGRGSGGQGKWEPGMGDAGGKRLEVGSRR
jgi:hypothetical protein